MGVETPIAPLVPVYSIYILYKGNQKIRSCLKWDYALYRSQLPALMGASNDDADDEVLADASDKRNLASLAKNNFFPKHEYKRALNAGKHFFYLLHTMMGTSILKIPISQYTERNLNKIAKPFNETFTGLKCMLLGFRMCFS